MGLDRSGPGHFRLLKSPVVRGQVLQGVQMNLRKMGRRGSSGPGVATVSAGPTGYWSDNSLTNGCGQTRGPPEGWMPAKGARVASHISAEARDKDVNSLVPGERVGGYGSPPAAGFKERDIYLAIL